MDAERSNAFTVLLLGMAGLTSLGAAADWLRAFFRISQAGEVGETSAFASALSFGMTGLALIWLAVLRL